MMLPAATSSLKINCYLSLHYNGSVVTLLTCKFKYLMLSNGRSRLDACSEGGVSGFLPRKTMVSDGCASKFPWCKFLFSTNVLWYSKTIDLAALRWLSSRGIDKSEIKKAIWNLCWACIFFCQAMVFAKDGKVRIFWEGHKILSGRFFQILWPSQNIRTLI